MQRARAAGRRRRRRRGRGWRRASSRSPSTRSRGRFRARRPRRTRSRAPSTSPTGMPEPRAGCTASRCSALDPAEGQVALGEPRAEHTDDDRHDRNPRGDAVQDRTVRSESAAHPQPDLPTRRTRPPALVSQVWDSVPHRTPSATDATIARMSSVDADSGLASTVVRPTVFKPSPLTDSNRRPPPYHGGALPAELRGRGPESSRTGSGRPALLPRRAHIVLRRRVRRGARRPAGHRARRSRSRRVAVGRWSRAGARRLTSRAPIRMSLR